ncbi:MAG: hypothetical protein RBS34_15500 [Desulfofustis sp.]|jgi:hypothetical protein|nr:hypothetical protein [Desulfofustis sp.]
MAEKRIIATEIEYEPLKDSERFTEEEQIDQCCEEVSVDECADVGRVSPFVSRDQDEWDFDPDEIAAGYAKTYGDKFLGVELHQVGPKGNCGEKHETWEDRLNCCDEVEPLEIDRGNSAQVLAPGTHGNVYFSGGKFPVLVRVRGNGFTLDGYNQRDGWVDGPGRGFTIFAHEFACGSCPITISDGCTTAHYSLRATVGHWDGWCVTYRWQRPGLREFANRNVYGVRYDSDRCTYSVYLLVSGYTGILEYRDPYAGGSVNLVSFFRWVGFWTPHANSEGNGMIQSPVLLPGEFDKVIAHCEGLGIPYDTHPNDYAPNGPADIYSVCSAPAYPCRFIC